MPMAEINIIPLGSPTPSVSDYVAGAVRILEEAKADYELTSMGTIIQGSLEEIWELARKMHEVPFQKGILRVVTTIKIDDRRDKKATSKDKVASVIQKIRG